MPYDISLQTPDTNPDDETQPEQAKIGIAEILQNLAADESRERISVADILATMGDRAFGALMLIFALPNIVPTPPGTSAVTGTPLVFLAAQLMLGQKPWLPSIIAKRSIARSDFGTIVSKVTPILNRAQRFLKPRFSVMLHPFAERIWGFICLVLAIILALPIPLGNILPAIAICLFSFALLERDGVFASLGAVLSAVSLVVVSGVLYAIFKAVLYFLTMPWL